MKILTKFVYQSSLAATQSPVTSMFVRLHATSVTSAWIFFMLIKLIVFRSLLVEVLVAWLLIQSVTNSVRNTTTGLFKSDSFYC